MTKRKLLNQNVLFFLISLLGLFIFSCKNPLAQSQENQLSKETVKLKISTNLARTVLPTQFNAGTPGLTWTLTGIKDGTSTDLGTWSDEDNTTAYSKMTSTEISVDVGTWNFTLDVTNSSGEKVLTGTTGSIDVSENSTLTFVMQEPTGEGVAQGQIDFTLNFPRGVVGKVEASLTEYGETNAEMDPQTFTPQTGEAGAYVKYIKTVDAGTYMLKLDLQQQDPADTGQYETINTYTCLIRVAPGLCSTGTERLNSLAKLYKITYELNGGTIDPNVTITSYNQYTKFKLPTPTRGGDSFLGWCTDEICPNESCEHLQADTTILISQDTTLYAKWQAQPTSAEPSDQTNGLSYFSKTENGGGIDCFEISTTEGLNAYRDYINGTIDSLVVAYRDSPSQTRTFSGNPGRIDAYLKEDITVDNWIPIGIYNGDTASNKLYSSNFYGNGYTIIISSVNSSATNVGLFGYAGNYESPNTISNLIVEGDFSTVTPKYAGGIVSYAMGVNIENCVNYATIKATFSAGGIVGYIGKNSTNSIKKCINLGEIQQNTDVYYGGIAGFAYTVNISDCINLKDLPVSSLGNTSGIVFVDTNVTSSIDRCINVGKSACPSAYAIANSGVKSNCYYNSETTYDGWQDLIDKTDENVIQKTTADLCALNSGDLSDQWSFAEEGDKTRYPLPNLSGVYNATVWSAITSAEEVVIETPPSGNVITTVTTESLSAGGEFVVSQEIIEVSSTIEISNSVSITGSSSIVTIKRAESFSNGPVFKISSDGSLTLSNIIIDGGAIFDLTEDIVKNNKVQDSLSGICADDGPLIVNNGGTVNLNDGSVLKNSWSSYFTNYEGGAAVFMDSGELIINGGQIIKNYSNTAGGAIYVTGGNINIIDGKISNNYSTQRGGGIYVYPEDANVIINMTGGEISGNAAGTEGGGLSVKASGSENPVELNLISGKINNNYAKTNGGGAYLYMGNPQSKCIVGGDTTGTFEVYQNEVGLFSNNSTAGGAGLYIHSSKNGTSGEYLFEIKKNTKIYDNTVYGNPTNVQGLGVYISSGMIKMSGGSIYNNKADSVTNTIKGGGIYINNIDSFYMSGGSIKDNCENQNNVEGKQIYNNTATPIIINDVEKTGNIEDNIEIP